MHWADSCAEEIIERSKKEGNTATIRTGQTPSGGKHIGNMNDVVRGYFPYAAVKERGTEARFVHTTDDRDPLKEVPSKIADLDGKWHDGKDFPELREYYGRPLCRSPDPFGCCGSYAEHFTNVWMKGLEAIGVRPELHSNDKLYREGKFEPYILKVFRDVKRVGEIAHEFQRTKAENYIPFDAICPKCGVYANIDSFDIEKKTVHFTCGGKAIKKKRAEGCGFTGEVPWSEGKLQWRFEWPAQWGIFGTTFEPFGKDHYEGSWKSGQVIARELYGIEPPIPFVYEFFLVNSQKMSASVGNVYIAQDMLKIIEPEVFLFFYSKRPEAQRDLDLKNVFRMVDEFDKYERIYFGTEEVSSELREENYKRMYELSAKAAGISEKAPVRISYLFASALAQLFDTEGSLKKLEGLGHLDGATGKDIENARLRLWLAKNWVEMYASDEFKLRVLDDNDAAAVYSGLTEVQKRILSEFASFAEKNSDENERTNKAKELCTEHGTKINDFFEAAYTVLIGKKKGPRLMPFISALDKKLVIRRLRGM